MKNVSGNPLVNFSSARLALLAVVVLVPSAAEAANYLKADTTGLTATTDWTTGVVPTSTDVGEFDSTISSGNESALTLGASWSVGGLKFDNNLNGPVTVGATANKITLGASGIDMSAANQDVSLNNAILFNASQTLNVASGRTLTLYANNSGSSLTQGSGTTTTFSGADGNAVCAFTFADGSGGLLTAGANWKMTQGHLTTTSGRNFNANLEIDGGTFDVLSGASRLSMAKNNQTFTMTGGTLNIPNISSGFYGLRLAGDSGPNGASQAATWTGTQSGGTINIYKGGGSEIGFGLGGNGNVSGSATYTLSGTGILNDIGTSGNGTFCLGADSTGNYTTTFNLEGGKLLVSGTATNAGGSDISGYTVGAKQVFNWTGGTLVCGSYVAANLISPAGGSTGTLVNGGGTLAPGDVGSSGKTFITGNYSVNSPSASLAIDLGGTTASSVFQDAANAGKFDLVAVSGTAALGGSLNVALIGGFVPASANTFKILTTAASGVSGTFNNVYNGRVTVANISGGSLAVTYNTADVTLGGYAALAANWTVQNASAPAGSTVTFTDNGSVGAITTWTVDFGDGSAIYTYQVSAGGTLSGVNTTHVYTGGNYTASLTVTASDGSTATTTQAITASSNPTLAWLGTATANWNTTDQNWTNLTAGGLTTLYAAGDPVVFDEMGSAEPTVNLLSGVAVAPSSVTFSNSVTTYTLQGAGKITATASLAKSLAGTTIILTTNDYSGGTTINGGTLQVGNGTASGSLGGGGIADNAALVYNVPDSPTIANAISGSGTLTKTGAGTLTLPNANSYSGGTHLTAGIMSMGNAASLGTAGTIEFNGSATLQWGTGLTTDLSSRLKLDDGITATIDVGANNVTFANALALGTSGSGGLAKAGSGALTLNGVNSYTGPTLVDAGALNISSGGLAAGSAVTVAATGSGVLTVNSGATVNGAVEAQISSAYNTANVVNNGTIGGTLTLDAAATAASPNNNATATVATGQAQLNAGSTTGSIVDNGQLTLSGSTAITSIGTISGSGGYGGINDKNTYSGGKTLTLANNSWLSYYQPQNNVSSTLQVAGNGSAHFTFFGYNDTTSIAYSTIFNGGTWIIDSIGQNNSGAHFVGTATIQNGATVTMTGNPTTAGAPITSIYGGNLAAYSHGTWSIINGSMTFNGSVSEGHAANNFGLNLTVNNTGGGPGSSLNINGALTLGYSSSQTNTAAENNSLTIGSGGAASATGLTVGNAAQNFPESDTVTLSGGKLQVGGTIASSGSALANVTSGFNWTGGQLTALTITPSAGFNGSGSSINSTTLTQSAGTMAPGDLGLPGKTAINGAYTITSGTLAIDLGGATAASVFQDGTSNSYDNLSISGAATLGGNLMVNVLNNFDPSGASFTIVNAAGGSTGGFANVSNGRVPVANRSNGSFRVTVSGNTVVLDNYEGIIWSGSQGSDWNTANNWKDSSGNPITYSDALGASGVYFDDTGAAAVSLSQTISPASVTISNTTVAYVFSGTGKISGSATVNKVGAGTASLQTANDYAGLTTVIGGALNIQNGGALGSVSAGTVVNLGAELQLQGGITTLAEPLVLSGTGTNADGALRSISGNNNFTGPITLTGGTAVRIAADSGSTLTLSSATPIIGNNTLFLSGGSLVVNSPIQTGNNPVNASAANLVLNSVNTYSGPTTISSGELVGVTGGSCANSAVTVASGATNGVQLAGAGGQWICGGLTYGSGAAYADFNFTNQSPSTATAPLQINGDFTPNATVNILVRNGTGWNNSLGTSYPLFTWTGAGPADLSAFSTAVQSGVDGLGGSLSLSGSTISFVVGLKAPDLAYGIAPTVPLVITLSDLENAGLQSAQSSPSFSIVSVSPTSTAGGVVTYNAGTIKYTYPASGSPASDSFAYTVSDGTVSATATVTLTFASAVGPQLTPALDANNNPVLTFQGIPGYSYHVQRSYDLSTWTTLEPAVTAPANGTVTWTDTSITSPPQVYYRLSYP